MLTKLLFIFLGGSNTFSAFDNKSTNLLSDCQSELAMVYHSLNRAAGMVAVQLGQVRFCLDKIRL